MSDREREMYRYAWQLSLKIGALFFTVAAFLGMLGAVLLSMWGTAAFLIVATVLGLIWFNAIRVNIRRRG